VSLVPARCPELTLPPGRLRSQHGRCVAVRAGSMDRDEYCYRVRDVSIRVVDVMVLSGGSDSSSPCSSPLRSSSRDWGLEELESQTDWGSIEAAGTCEWCENMRFIICPACRASDVGNLGMRAGRPELTGPGEARELRAPRQGNFVTHGPATEAITPWDETPNIDMDQKPSGSVFGGIVTAASAMWNVGPRLFGGLFSSCVMDEGPDTRWYSSSDDFRRGPSQVCFAPSLHSSCGVAKYCHHTFQPSLGEHWETHHIHRPLSLITKWSDQADLRDVRRRQA
jgi:hypothetical protein